MREKGGVDFKCHKYLEHKKVELVVIAFTDYVIVWWG